MCHPVGCMHDWPAHWNQFNGYCSRSWHFKLDEISRRLQFLTTEEGRYRCGQMVFHPVINLHLDHDSKDLWPDDKSLRVVPTIWFRHHSA
nr:hypothetical transcript [Hymenolepis microstoma]